MAISITESELVAAVQQANFGAEEDDTGAFTLKEAQMLTGLGPHVVRSALGNLCDQGLCVRVKARKADGLGDVKTVKCFRLVDVQ